MRNSRSLLTTLAAGVRKSNDMSLVTDARGLWRPVLESFAGAWQRNIVAEGVGSLAAYSPVYACVSRISGDVSKLGLDLMTETDVPGVTERAPADSPFWRVLRRPNSFQNRIQFVRYWMICKLLFGNAYAVKSSPDGRGMFTELYLLDPRRVTPHVTEVGDVYYSIGGDNLAKQNYGGMIPSRLMIHDRGPTLWNPLIGVPPVFACALSGTLGIKIQQQSATFFGNQSRPSGFLTAPKTIDEVTANRLKESWETNYSGTNLGRTAVLGDGLTYSAMTLGAEQSQLAEQLGISAVDIATAFGMPAYKINQGPMPTSNNVQALNQQYYADALQTLIEEFELCMSEGLNLLPGYTVECNLDGLLRMDSLTQMDVMAKGVGAAIIKPNEARAKMNRRPATGGDELYLQEQNYSLPALAERDQNHPFAAPPAPATVPAPTADPAAGDPAPPAAKGLDMEVLRRLCLEPS